MKNIFDPKDVAAFEKRIQMLTPQTRALWGTMNVAQMLAHCNVAYVMAFENEYPPLGPVKQFLLKLLVKGPVVNDKPYKKRSPTAKEFQVSPVQDFEIQKEKLIQYLRKTCDLGTAYFEGKPSRSFGPLSAKEWNNLFAKHLDHHLSQFGV